MSEQIVFECDECGTTCTTKSKNHTLCDECRKQKNRRNPHKEQRRQKSRDYEG